MARQRGIFISVEGVEGSGKTSLVVETNKWIAEQGINCVSSKEPGTVWGGAARRILLEQEELNPAAETFLFMADRAEHVAKIIKPGLKQGHWVLLDRFVDSTIVYQGFVREAMPVTTLLQLHNLATGGLFPDITLLLDVEPERAAKRLAKREDQNKRLATGKGVEFLSYVRDSFLEVAKSYPDRFILIDANQSKDKVKAQVLELMKPLVSHWRSTAGEPQED